MGHIDMLRRRHCIWKGMKQKGVGLKELME